MNLRRDMRLTHIGSFLLLVLGTANAMASAAEYGRIERAFLQQAAVERNLQGGEQPGQRQSESRRGRLAGLPDTSGYTTQGDSGSGSQDNARRAGRMSPEERRALRRQIDEAGHDIYAPRR